MGRGIPSLGAGAEPDGQALQGLGRTIRGSRPKACTRCSLTGLCYPYNSSESESHHFLKSRNCASDPSPKLQNNPGSKKGSLWEVIDIIIVLFVLGRLSAFTAKKETKCR